jgi:hypothetical protein
MPQAFSLKQIPFISMPLSLRDWRSHPGQKTPPCWFPIVSQTTDLTVDAGKIYRFLFCASSSLSSEESYPWQVEKKLLLMFNEVNVLDITH